MAEIVGNLEQFDQIAVNTQLRIWRKLKSGEDYDVWLENIYCVGNELERFSWDETFRVSRHYFGVLREDFKFGKKVSYERKFYAANAFLQSRRTGIEFFAICGLLTSLTSKPVPGSYKMKARESIRLLPAITNAWQEHGRLASERYPVLDKIRCSVAENIIAPEGIENF